MQHSKDKLKRFLKHLNSIQKTAVYTNVETEENKQLSFLDVLIKKQTNKKFGTGVYRKNTHTLTDT